MEIRYLFAITMDIHHAQIKWIPLVPIPNNRNLPPLHLPKVNSYLVLYSVRGLERSELGGSHGCPGRLWDRFLWQVYQNDSRMLWTEYWPVIKIGPKGALGSHEIRPIYSAPSLGQSIAASANYVRLVIYIDIIYIQVPILD